MRQSASCCRRLVDATFRNRRVSWASVRSAIGQEEISLLRLPSAAIFDKSDIKGLSTASQQALQPGAIPGRSRIAVTHTGITRLKHAVDASAAEMKVRLRERAMKGHRRWDEPEQDERCVCGFLCERPSCEGSNNRFCWF